MEQTVIIFRKTNDGKSIALILFGVSYIASQ